MAFISTMGVAGCQSEVPPQLVLVEAIDVLVSQHLKQRIVFDLGFDFSVAHRLLLKVSRYSGESSALNYRC